MRRYILIAILCGALVSVIWAGAFTATAADVKAAPTPKVRLLPVVRLKADSDLRLELVLDVSGAPLRYLFRNDDLPVDLIYFHLVKDEQIVPQRADVPNRPLVARRVRELKPGDQLRHTLDLREQYRELKPGRYALEVRASGGPRDFGLSQIHLSERLLYIDIH